MTSREPLQLPDGSDVFSVDEVEQLVFSDDTEKAIEGMVKSEFCRPDQELTAQINELFPTEQSLNQLDAVIASVEAEILDLDCQLADLVETQAEVGHEGEQALQEAHKAMAELEKRIESIRGKTKSSDEVVREMTRDIHQLDVAKRNLTASITTLHHLHILLTGVESLGTWVLKRDYASIARQLPAVLNVLELFDSFQDNNQIQTITSQLDKLKHTLTLQLAGDLKNAFQAGSMSETVTDMCRVAAALEGNVKDNFCRWFIDQQLSEYTVLYAENEEGAWLDKIDERYKWYVRRLTDFERTGLAKVFPPDWDMGRRMTQQFCQLTREMFARMMTRRRQDLEWRLVGHAIQHTKMFESLLVKRFPPKGDYNFDKAIWQVFDPFLDVFIAAQERTLNDFIEACAQKIRSGSERPSRETSTHAVPLPSSADLFLLLKKVFTESSKLCSVPDGLLKDVVGLVRTCLRGYAYSCLTAFIPQQNNVQSSNAVNLFNLIRDDVSPVRLTADQQFLACCILATADWCAETTIQLQEKLSQRLPGVDLAQESETFYSIANSAIAVLVQDVEGACDASLQAMTKTNWMAIDAVGDESPFVGSIRGHLRQSVPDLRDLMSDRRKYFAHLCLKLATQLSHKYVGAVFRCKPLSTHGAEQLLLDTHSLKTFLLSLPSVDSKIQTKPPGAYTSAVHTAMTKAEMILKIVMSDIASPEEFVSNYSKLLPQSDVNEMQKVLEMRGVKRSEQSAIVQVYRNELGLGSGPVQPMTASEALSTVVSMAADGLADTSMRRLEKLVKKL